MDLPLRADPEVRRARPSPHAPAHETPVPDAPQQRRADSLQAHVLAMQELLGNRAVQHLLSDPRPAAEASVQRFPAEPGNTDLDLWQTYLVDVGELLDRYTKDKDVKHLEVADHKDARARLDRIDQAINGAKSAIAAHRKDDALKGKVSALGRLLPGMSRSLNNAIVAAEELLKPPPVAPAFTHSVEVENSLLQYKIDPIPILVRLESQKKPGELENFSKALYLTLNEVYTGVTARLVDFGSAYAQLAKLAKGDSGTFSGVLAEFQGIAQLIKTGELDPARPASMGLNMVRPEPFNAAGPTQDVDISYASKAGVTQLIEVKDSVATLDTKMNAVVGNDAKTAEQKFESRQILSLASLREAEQAKGQKVEIKIMCVYPFGWVRFVMGHNCQKLLDHNITLVIAGREFRPAALRQLREKVGSDLEKLDLRWKEKSVDASMPKRTPGPDGNRHEAHWKYEDAHKLPPA